jgi:HEXXH motif-containing protein
VDLSHRLWQDRSIFQLRADKQAAALVAVFHALDKHRPLRGGESEAIDLHRFVIGLDEDVVSDVLDDPYAHFWTRLAFALCGAVLRGEGVPAAARVLSDELGTRDVSAILQAHLEQYKRLALAAAISAKTRLDLAVPFEVSSPFAVPASGASLTGEGRLRILGVEDGRFLIDGAGRFESCPTVSVAGWSVPLQADGWLVPGLGWAAPAARTSRSFQECHRELVESGLAMIARYQPDVFEQMRETIRWIAVNPVSEGNALNYVSYSELPGAFAFQGIPRAYSAAEACIHEFHHNRLFCLEECEPILAGDALGTEDDANFYSPWREGLRPLRGVLHGTYVTAAQFRFWLAFARAPETRGTVADFVAGQIIRQSVVVDIGLGQLERHARLTPEGALLMAEMRRNHDQLAAEADELGIPRDIDTMVPASDGGFEKFRDKDGATLTMRESIVRHIGLYDVQRQVPAEWLAANSPNHGPVRPSRAAMGRS